MLGFDDLFDKCGQMRLKVLDAVEIERTALGKIVDADLYRLAQCLQPDSLLGLMRLDQSQSCADDFVGVLIAPRSHQGLDHFVLSLGHLDIPRWHATVPPTA
jgi:hypothetical protein